MNLVISQGQAIRSVFGRARVTHFMVSPSVRTGPVRGQALVVEVAAGDVVAGDRLVADGLVDVGGGEPVPVGVATPAANTTCVGPTGQDTGSSPPTRRSEA